MKVVALASLLMVTLVYPAAGAIGGSAGTLQRVSGESPFRPGGSHQCSLDDAMRDHELEPSITTDPSDPNRVAVAWPQDNALGIIVASSRDGGRTWSRTVVDGFTTCTGSDKARVSHPRVRFASDGLLYLAAFPVGEFGEFEPRNIMNEILVARSDDGGLTWSRPHQITQAETLNDFSGLATEPDTGAVEVIWAENEAVDPLGEPIYLSRSTDRGETWDKKLVTRAAPGSVAFAKVAPLPSGELLVFLQEVPIPSFFPTSAGPHGSISVLVSDTKGETWSAARQVVDDAIVGWPNVAVTGNGMVYLTYRTRTADGKYSVWLTRSDDGAATWTESVQAFSYEYAHGTNPDIALAVTGEATIGVLHFVKVDAQTHEARLAVSPNCGRNWTSRALGQPFSEKDLGFGQGLTAAPHGFLASVSLGGEDDTIGKTDIFVAPIHGGGAAANSCHDTDQAAQ